MRKLLASIVSFLMVIATLGCSITSNTSISGASGTNTPQFIPVQSTGAVKVLITDAPAKKEITSIMVHVSGVKVHRAVSQEEPDEGITATVQPTQYEDGEWLDIGITGANPFDLLQLRGVEELLAVNQLEAGRYTQVRLDIERVEVAIDGGELTEAKLPSNQLKITRPFDVLAGETTVLTIDIDAQQSLNITDSDRITVKPVVKLTISHEASRKISSYSGLVQEIDVAARTVTLQTSGQDQPVTLNINARSIILLDGIEAGIEDLAQLPPEAQVSLSYDTEDLTIIHMEVTTPST